MGVKKKYDTASIIYMPQQELIEKYFKDKGNKGLYDGNGWTGEFHLSAKDIINMLLDLEAERKRIKVVEHNKQQVQKFRIENLHEVTDKLCIRYLTREGVTRDKITPEIIELKRGTILFARMRIQINKLKHEKQNNRP